MDFSFNEEQQLIKDSVDRFVREEYELDQRRKLVASETGYSEENWAMMAELQAHKEGSVAATHFGRDGEFEHVHLYWSGVSSPASTRGCCSTKSVARPDPW